VEHASRSSSLLRVEASLARVSQSGLKTGGGTTMGGALAPSRRLHRRQVEDGLVDVTGYIGPATLHLPFLRY
jgi:hypothetical protein